MIYAVVKALHVCYNVMFHLSCIGTQLACYLDVLLPHSVDFCIACLVQLIGLVDLTCTELFLISASCFLHLLIVSFIAFSQTYSHRDTIDCQLIWKMIVHDVTTECGLTSRDVKFVFPISNFICQILILFELRLGLW